MVDTIKIIATIVTYNPDIDRLNENIKSVYCQVDEIYIYDNASKNVNQILDKINDQKIKIYCAKKNQGIAVALNLSLQYAYDNGYEWLLQLDQDSVFPYNGIDEYKKIIAINNEIGIIAPRIIDRNYQVNNEIKGEWEYIDETINSGALVNVCVWKKIGGYDEKIFLDNVDFDYDNNLRNNGYKIVRNNNVFLLHELGNTKRKKILGKEMMIYNYSAKRKYSQIIDQFYYEKKNGRQISKYVIIRRMMKYIFIAILFENDKINKVKSIVKAGIKSIELYT